jgi:O-antigen ligase
LIAVAVAVLYVALAIGNGGYSSELTAGATVATWWAVVIAMALGGWPRSRVPAAAVGAGVCLAALAAWMAISLGWASDDGAAFVEVVRALGYLGLFVLVVIASPRGSARTWLGGLAVGITIVAALALLSRFEPSFGADRKLGAFLPAAAGRLSYPIGYWNGLAAVVAMGAVLLVWLGGHARNAVSRAAAVAAIPLPILVVFLTSSRGGVFAGLAGLLVLLAIGPARERMLGGLVIGGVGGALLVSLASDRHELVDALGNSTAVTQGDQMLAFTIAVVLAVGLLRFLVDDWLGEFEVSERLTRAVGVGVVIAIVAGILVANPSERWEEFKRAAPLEKKSTYVAAHLTSGRGGGRYQFWSTALDAFEAHPVGGIGAGGYKTYWNQHGTLVRPVNDAHSLFLETMAELGLVGLVLVLGFLVFAAVSGLRRWPTLWPGGALGAALAVFVTGVVSAAIDWTWELPACFGVVVLAAALLTGPATLRPEPAIGPVPVATNGGGARISRRRASRFGLGMATILVGWAAIWAGGDQFLTQVKLDDSQAAASAGDLSSAAQDARDARTLQPWAAEPRFQLALVEELGRDLRAAKRELNEAIERAPEDWRLWFVLVRLEFNSGNVKAAKRALEQARRLNPRAPFLAR